MQPITATATDATRANMLTISQVGMHSTGVHDQFAWCFASDGADLGYSRLQRCHGKPVHIQWTVNDGSGGSQCDGEHHDRTHHLRLREPCSGRERGWPIQWHGRCTGELQRPRLPRSGW